MYKQVTEKDWAEIVHPISICSIDQPIEEFAEKHNLNTFSYQEDGLGQLTALVFKVENILYWAKGPSGNGKDYFTLFEVRSFEKNTLKAFNQLCEEFKFNRNDFEWISENLGVAEWLLTRLDDNGNETPMFFFHDEQSANMAKNEYEKRGHKQSYFVTKIY